MRLAARGTAKGKCSSTMFWREHLPYASETVAHAGACRVRPCKSGPAGSSPPEKMLIIRVFMHVRRDICQQQFMPLHCASKDVHAGFLACVTRHSSHRTSGRSKDAGCGSAENSRSCRLSGASRAVGVRWMQDIMTRHEQSGKESVEAISTRPAWSGLVRYRNTLFVKNGRYV
jgi:hypothetical protein